MVINERIHVFGGGVAGLVTAYELLKTGVSVVVYEREKAVGGLAKSFSWSGWEVDQGPHIYHSPDPDMIEYLKDEFGSMLCERDHYAANLKGGRYYPYPISEEFIEELPKDVSARIYQELSEREDSNKKFSATTFAEYVEAMAGPTLARLFFTDYPRKLWGVPTEELDANWAPKRVSILKNKRAFYGDQYSAVGVDASGSVIRELYRKIIELGGEIHLGAEVSAIEVLENRIASFKVNGEKVKLGSRDRVVNTFSAVINASLFHFDTELRYRGVFLSYAKLSTSQVLPAGVDFIYVDDHEILFNRVSDQNKFIGSPKPGETVVCCEITYSADDEIDRADPNDIVTKTVDQLISLDLIRAEDVLDTTSVKLPSVYPMFYLGYKKDLARYLNYMNALSNMFLLGSLAEYAYSDLQILMAKGRDLARVISSGTLKRNNLVKNNSLKNLNVGFSVSGLQIGEGAPPFIVGEIGINHNGSVEVAKDIISMAASCGVSAVKLQSYKSARRVSPNSSFNRFFEKVLDTEETDYAMFKKYELTPEETSELFEFSRKQGLLIFTAVFDVESLVEIEALQADLYKIASFDIINHSLLQAVAETGKPTLISTGMATLGEIEEAIEIFLKAGNPNVALFQCTSQYPAPAESINLRVMDTLRTSFGCPVGLSDHSIGTHIPLAAIARGADLIEKHITLDCDMEGPDHSLSLDPEGLRDFCLASKEVCSALGDGIKKPTETEKRTALRFRKSMHAISPLPVGHCIQPDDIEYVAPAWGLFEVDEPLVLGRQLKVAVGQGDPITLEHFSD